MTSWKSSKILDFTFSKRGKFDNYSHDMFLENDYSFYSYSNGGYVTSPKIGRYCGNRIYPIIKSDSNILMVKFRSDNSLSAPGFEIFWDGTTIGKHLYNMIDL